MSGLRRDLDPGTICRVLEAAGHDVPEKARAGRKAEMCCIFGEAHKHGDCNRSAYVDAEKNVYGCAICGTFTAKKLAEALSVDWKRILEDLLSRERKPPGASRTETPAPTPAEVIATWDAGLAFTATLTATAGMVNGQEDEAFAYLVERHLAAALAQEDGREPLAVILPVDGAGLPPPYAKLAGNGYRIAARLWDARSGDLGSLQLRFAGNHPPNLGPKALFPRGEGQASGKAFLNPAALDLVRLKDGPPARLIFGEGLTDHLALSLALPADLVACVAGTGNVRNVLGENGKPRPTWLREGLEIVTALDADAAGEKALEEVLKLARAAGATVLRVRWPDGCKDACDVLKAHGPEAVAHAVNGAEENRTRFLACFEWAPDLLAREVKKPRGLLGEGLLNAGDFALLYGPPGAGKTWAALSLALALAAGEDWLGIRGSGEPLRVGYFAMELPAYHLKARLSRLVELLELSAAPPTLALLCRPELKGAVDLATQEHADELLDFCRSLALDLVFLDPLSRVHTADERDAAGMAQVLAFLERVRLESGTALDVVHHNRKEQAGRKSENVLDEIRGTSRLASDPTLIMRLASHRGLMELSFPKPNFAPPPAPIHLKRLEAGGFEVTDAPQRAEEEREAKIALALEVIREAGPGGISPADLAKQTGRAERTARSYAGQLERAGKIRRGGATNRTRYVATEHSGTLLSMPELRRS